MKRTYREGVDIEVAFSAGMKQKAAGRAPCVVTNSATAEETQVAIRLPLKARCKHALKRIARPFYRWLKPLFRPFAARARSYFIEQFKQELLHEVRRSAASTTSAQNAVNETLTSLKRDIAGLRMQFSSDVERRPQLVSLGTREQVEFAEPENNLFHIQSLWDEISSLWAEWVNCEVIYASPMMYAGARILFEKAKVIKVQGMSDVVEHISQDKPRAFNQIGIISPSIAREMATHRYVASLLARECRGRTLLLCDNLVPEADTGLRQLLHRHGFYEVAVASKDVNGGICLDHSSIGLNPDGSEDFRSNVLGINKSRDKAFTLIAGRAAMSQGRIFRWRRQMGDSLALTVDGWSEYLGPGLSITTGTLAQDDGSNSFSVKANIRWKECGDGHFSLISCYDGPGDTNMYAALLSFEDPHTLSVSLWRNTGEWQRIEVVSRQVESRGLFHQVSLRLITLPLSVEVEIEGATVISVQDVMLTRRAVMGVRLSGATFSFKELETSWG